MRLHTIEEGLPVALEWSGQFDQRRDVAVVGLGTAGALAAIAAGREGLDVVGIEPHSYMGGVGTGGGIHVYYHGTRGGIQEEVDEAVTEYSRAYARQGVRGFHPDAKKYALEKLAREAGVELLYRSRITGVYRHGPRVVGIRVIAPAGTLNIATKFVIDASGDAETCALAGCAFRLGRRFDGQPQPYSMPHGFINHTGKVDGANFDAGYVDPTDAVDFSRAICRGQTLHLRARFTAENRLLYCVSHPGLREGRFIVGEQTLLFEDLLLEKSVDNSVMQTYAHHDNHAQDWAFESDAAQDWVTVCGFWSRKTLAQVPYGVVVPKGIDGLFVAGRAISLDHDSSQTFRMQRDMQKLGEVAAVAASLAIACGCAARDVPYEQLRTRLAANGCLPKRLKSWEPWMTDAEQIRSGLAADDPGVAIWSAKLQGDAIVERLLAWIRQTTAENLRVNAAFALGLLGRPQCLPALRERVVLRDTTLPDNNKHRTQQRNHAAMYLLGRFADREILPVLLCIAGDPASGFQDFTQALVAALRIGREHAEARNLIAATLVEHLTRQDFHLALPLAEQHREELDRHRGHDALRAPDPGAGTQTVGDALRNAAARRRRTAVRPRPPAAGADPAARRA